MADTDFTVEERAVQAARTAWEQENVRHLLVGLLRGNRPLLGREPFYIGSLGCEASDEKLRFCAAFNEAIASLVSQHGIPEWAPLSRRPDRKCVLEMLANQGQPLVSLNLERPPYEYRLFRTLLSRWQRGPGRKGETTKPLLWCRDRGKGRPRFRWRLVGEGRSRRCFGRKGDAVDGLLRVPS